MITQRPKFLCILACMHVKLNMKFKYFNVYIDIKSKSNIKVFFFELVSPACVGVSNEPFYIDTMVDLRA